MDRAGQTVFHEIISDKVHIDIHVVAPSKKFPWYTLVTSGMSDVPMRAPEQYPDLAFAELFLCLPPDWKMGGRGLEIGAILLADSGAQGDGPVSQIARLPSGGLIGKFKCARVMRRMPS